MSKETKIFDFKLWKAIIIFVIIQIITGFIVNLGSIRIGLKQIEINKNDIVILGTSVLELQFNQQKIANDEEIILPYQYTLTRNEP